ncbi:hypothetical protein GCM10027416_08330 [Okibacterium endophyticum]
MLGYVTNRPISLVDVLGREGFDEFTSLTSVHGDGWGMAWQDPSDHSTRTVTSPQTAVLDADYADLAARPLGSAGFAHLRWATASLAVKPENTHPFSHNGYAFAHNGNLAPISRLDELLTDSTRARLKGDTDSERYFHYVLQCIEEYRDEAEGVTRALDRLVREFPNASLNALMLTPHSMFAIHINSRVDSPRKELRALFETEDALPARHTTEYYAMDYKITDDAVYVISSGVDTQGWDDVPPDSAAMIDLTTREITRLHPVALG